jgi:acyl-coenzyme A synthetase/AMP-(fatty) acid ligase
VYPSQVESILESHPSVASAFVLGIEDDIKGSKPYAFVILEKNKNVTEEELKQHALNNGPAYQHPRKIWFLEEFPLAGTNKINKKILEKYATENLANQL